jgi:hypothetical protein
LQEPLAQLSKTFFFSVIEVEDAQGRGIPGKVIKKLEI